jgi:8-oxo-dGTP pyrophosphatase MutT (NUDIX family)
VIPRPPTAEPGGPAPWSGAPPALVSGITVARVVEALERAGRRLPGPPPPPPRVGAIRAVAPGPVVAPPAAVLVGLFEEEGESRVILTRRATTLRAHRAQVSFPGGRLDPGEDAVEAALREAHEEVGLDPGVAHPVGLLAPALAFVSGAPITPVVCTMDARPRLVANPAEVDRIFDVALAELAAAYREERWREPGLPPFSMYFFDVAGETVWGATARMLVDLLTVVLTR